MSTALLLIAGGGFGAHLGSLIGRRNPRMGSLVALVCLGAMLIGLVGFLYLVKGL